MTKDDEVAAMYMLNAYLEKTMGRESAYAILSELLIVGRKSIRFNLDKFREVMEDALAWGEKYPWNDRNTKHDLVNHLKENVFGKITARYYVRHMSVYSREILVQMHFFWRVNRISLWIECRY